MQFGRNPLKGKLGGALHAVLCGAVHKLRPLIAESEHNTMPILAMRA